MTTTTEHRGIESESRPPVESLQFGVPRTALLDNNFWEECLRELECGAVADLLNHHQREQGDVKLWTARVTPSTAPI